MTTATKTIERKSGSKIELSMTREVVDDIAYADGWNVKTGRRIVELTSITLVLPNGRRASGSSINKVSDAKLIAKGGYARVGDAYVSQDAYEVIVAGLAELDAELGKSKEYIALKTAEANRKTRALENERRMDEERAARRKHVGWCDRCQDYTYGDCGH